MTEKREWMEISLPKVDVKAFHITRIRWKNSCGYRYDITSLGPLEIITDYSNTSVKVLFTERYTRQNFCLRFLRLVNNSVVYLQDAKDSEI